MEIRKYFGSSLNKENDPETEQDYRADCSWYEGQCSISDQTFCQNNPKYTNLYNQIMSLYLNSSQNNRTKAVFYGPGRNSKGLKTLENPELLIYGTCFAQLPNGELFCFGHYPYSGIAFIIDYNNKVRALPSGAPCWFSSAIYFNENVYCFGGYNDWHLDLSMKFVLNENRWTNLTPMLKPDYHCQSIIFRRNILIAGCFNKNILLYSIGIDSFSTIPYDFSAYKRKILINIGRLYLIEYDGFIYESEVEDEYNWKKIGNSILKDNSPYQAHCSYKKGEIYISIIDNQGYFKFDLSQKVMTRCKKPKLYLVPKKVFNK